jgi:RNA polymerase sigma-70 factor, ECF subfamily
LAARDGTDATERFVRLAGAELDRAYRLAGLILADQQEAEDAAQDAFERAWQSRGTLRDPAAFQAWFDRILVNVCRDRLRRRGRVRFVPIDSATGQVAAHDPYLAVFDRDAVLTAMKGLDEEERIVLVLHYAADLTLDAVAARLGWPIGTVKTRLHRALEAIRSRVDHVTEGPDR